MFRCETGRGFRGAHIPVSRIFPIPQAFALPFAIEAQIAGEDQSLRLKFFYFLQESVCDLIAIFRYLSVSGLHNLLEQFPVIREIRCIVMKIRSYRDSKLHFFIFPAFASCQHAQAKEEAHPYARYTHFHPASLSFCYIIADYQLSGKKEKRTPEIRSSYHIRNKRKRFLLFLHLVKQLAVEHAGSHCDHHHGKTRLEMIVEKILELTHESTSFLDLRRSSYYTICTKLVNVIYAQFISKELYLCIAPKDR